jgi:hypothetical protein
MSCTDQKSTKEILCTAALIVRLSPDKWCQFSRHDAGRMCALGLIEGVVNRSHDHLSNPAENYPKVLEAFAAVIPDDGTDKSANWKIASWNNAPERTAKDIVKAFEAAAASLDVEVKG